MFRIIKVLRDRFGRESGNWLLFLAFLVLAAYVPEVCAKDFQIDSANGVPRIFVDGQPVRARIFYGGVGSPLVDVGPTAKMVSVDFEPRVDSEGRGTVHFRFGPESGRVVLDDIELTDLSTNKAVAGPFAFETQREFDVFWRIWPPKDSTAEVHVEKNLGNAGSGGLVVDLLPTAGKRPDFHVLHVANLKLCAGRKYRFKYWVFSDKPRKLNVQFYRPGNPYVCLGGAQDVFDDQIKLAAQVGVDFVSFALPAAWPKPGAEPDFTAIDMTCAHVLTANPQALLLPRISLNAPDWWLAAHPTEKIGRFDGKGVVSEGSGAGYPSIASKLFRKDAAIALELTVRHIEEKYGDSFAGCHPSGQSTGEWFTPGAWNDDRFGFSDCEGASFRAFVQRKYPSDRELRKAWGESGVSLQNAEVPDYPLWSESEKVVWLDVGKNRRFQRVLDFHEWAQNEMADGVLELAAAARRAFKGKKLVLFFYGYSFEFGKLPDGPGKSGHYALERVLRSPDVDIICSPVSYWDREPGGYGHAMAPAESIALAGKMYLFEDDTRTYLAKGKNYAGWESGGKTLEATQGLLLRNTGMSALRNFATWWMDLGTSGWFDSPELWSQMAKLRPVDDFFFKNPSRFAPEIGLIVDEGSMLAASNNWMTLPVVYQGRKDLGRAGAPFGQYLLNDLLAGKIQTKLNIVAAATRLSTAQRKMLRKAAAGKTTIWINDPGFLDVEAGGSGKNIEEVTGFTVEPVDGNLPLALTQVGMELGLTDALNEMSDVPLRRVAIQPLPGDEVWAAYSDGRPAVVFRSGNDGTRSIYVGIPRLTSGLVRAAARKAGVHLFVEVEARDLAGEKPHEANVGFSNGFLLLHGISDGPVALDFGRHGKVVDMLDVNKIVGNGPRFRIHLKRGETRILRID